MSALGALLGAAGAKRFLRDAWPDTPWAGHRPLGALPRFFREAPLGTFEALAAGYAGTFQLAGGRGADHLQLPVSGVDPRHLRQVGLTVFFGDDVSPAVPAAAAWLRSLEAELGAPPGIGAIRAFASPAGGGLEPHYDQGETWVVQLEGTKRTWLSADRRYPTLQFTTGKPPADGHYPEFPEGFPSRPPKRGHAVTLRPGSVLFVPRGTWHRTEASTGSYSLSVCVDTPSPFELLVPALKATLQQSPRWRRPLFGGWGRGRRAALSELRALLGEGLPALAPEALIDPRLAPDRRPMQGPSRFQRVPTTALAVVREGKRWLLRATDAGGGEVRILVSEALRPLCAWLGRRRSAFTVAELLSAHPEARRVEVERLLRSLVLSDALKWLWYPAL